MNNINLGQVLSVMERIGSYNIQRFIDDDLIHIPVKLLRSMIPTWKTISVGGSESFKSAFSKRNWEFINCDTCFWKDEFPRISEEVIKVDLVNVSTADLGFEGPVYDTNRIFERAKKIGFQLCHPEIAPQLRLQYLDQSRFDSVLVPIDTSVSIPNNRKGDLATVIYRVDSLQEGRLVLMSFDLRETKTYYVKERMSSSHARWIFVKPLLNGAMKDFEH